MDTFNTAGMPNAQNLSQVQFGNSPDPALDAPDSFDQIPAGAPAAHGSAEAIQAHVTDWQQRHLKPLGTLEEARPAYVD
jgi:hypothetical protein